jgi:fibronectin type 3 domain-containing protein
MNLKPLLGSILVALIIAQVSLAHSAVLPHTTTTIAGDAENGQSSVATQGGQKLFEDTFGKFIAVYQDTSGRVAVKYTNSDPTIASSWSTAVRAGAASQYRTPAAVLVSPTSLRVIVELGAGPGNIVDLPATIQRDSQSNIVGVSFGSATILDSSGRAEFPAAILAHNGDIIAVWNWLDTANSDRVKAFRWKAGTGWTSLTGSGTVPDNAIVDTSNRLEIIPNLIQRPDNHNIYLVGNRDEDSSAKQIVFNKATFDGSNWSWGTQNLNYEINAARGAFDSPSMVWDPTRNVVVVTHDISGTERYAVFTLNSQDQKVHIDTPELQMGNNEWGSITVDPTTGDYYLFTIDTIDLALFHDNGMLGYTWRSGDTWNTALTILDSTTDNIAISLRRVGNSPFIDLLSENSRDLKLYRLTLTGGSGDTSPPTKPQGLTANVVSGARVNLSWQPSTDNIAVAGYDISRNGIRIATVTGTSYSDTSAQLSNTYFYTVVAFDASNNLSPSSDPVTVVMPRGVVLTPADDAYVRQDRPDQNFGSATRLNVDNKPVTNLLVKFSVTGVGGSTIQSAKLRLFNVDGSNMGGTFYAAVSNSWNGATVTWNNAPAAGPTLLGSLGSVSTGNWYEVDITSLITGDGTVTLRASSTSTNGASYSSNEGSNPPQLVIIFSGCNDCEPPSQPQNLTAIAVTSTHIDLSWDASTDNTGVAGYDIYRDSSYKATVDGGTTTYPNTSVSPGTTYTYNVVAFDGEGNRSPPSAPATATTPGGSSLLTFTPTDDASILAASPTSNFGSDQTLQADLSSLQNFLVKFTVTGVGSGQVVSANLRLFNVNPSSVGGVFYRAADNTWNEGSVTWDNAPAADPTPLASLGPVSTNTWYEVDLTSLITGDGVYSLRVTSTSSDGADYSSKEGANAPQLIVTLA